MSLHFSDIFIMANSRGKLADHNILSLPHSKISRSLSTYDYPAFSLMLSFAS